MIKIDILKNAQKNAPRIRKTDKIKIGLRHALKLTQMTPGAKIS